jgi:hypothetical protein
MSEVDKSLPAILTNLSGAQLLLQQLTNRLPPLARRSHSITFCQGKLQLNLAHVFPCENITFNEEDLFKPAARLVIEIAVMVTEGNDTSSNA